MTALTLVLDRMARRTQQLTYRIDAAGEPIDATRREEMLVEHQADDALVRALARRAQS